MPEQLARLRLAPLVTCLRQPMVEPGLEPRSVQGSFYSYTASPKYGLFHPKPGTPRGGMSRVWGKVSMTWDSWCRSI